VGRGTPIRKGRGGEVGRIKMEMIEQDDPDPGRLGQFYLV